MGFHTDSPEIATEVAYGKLLASHEVTVRDARPIQGELSLDREGFVLARHKTTCAGIRNPDVLAREYVEEMLPFIKEFFRASWVVPRSDAIFVRRAGRTRTNGQDTTEVRGVRIPASSAHIDYLPIAAPMVAARENQIRGIPIRSYSRLMI